MLDDDQVDSEEIEALDQEASGGIAKMSVAQIELSLAALSSSLPVEDVVRWLDLTAILVAKAKELRKLMERTAIEWIETNGPIAIGDIRYAVAHPTIVKCLDSLQCFDLVLNACNGDVGAFCEYLRSDPFKYGSVRQLLGQTVFEQVFRTEVRPKLVDGKPQKQLMRTDERFLR